MRIIRMQWCWLAVLAVVVLAGCNRSREAQLIGKWKVDASSMQMPAASGMNAQAQEMAKQMMSSMTLDLKADKTFDMNMMLPLSGTWALDETAGTVALTMTKMNNMDISKMPNASANVPMVLQIADDNSRLTAQNPAGAVPAPGGFAFVKE